MTDPRIAYIRNCTRNYKAYRDWSDSDPGVRGMFMASLKRDWECVGAIYRVTRRKDHYLRKVIERGLNG